MLAMFSPSREVVMQRNNEIPNRTVLGATPGTVPSAVDAFAMISPRGRTLNLDLVRILQYE
jgi:hypothetical protein